MARIFCGVDQISHSLRDFLLANPNCRASISLRLATRFTTLIGEDSVTVLERQNLLATLTEAIAEFDRAALGNIINLAADATWSSLKKRLVKHLIEADLQIEDRHQSLAETCRTELRQEREA